MSEMNYMVGSILIYATIGFFSWLLWWEKQGDNDERN